MSFDQLTTKTNEIIGQILHLASKKTGKQIELRELLNTTIIKFTERAKSDYISIQLQDYITDIPNFPKPGINFKDISPLLQNPKAMQFCINALAKQCRDCDVIVGLDAR